MGESDTSKTTSRLKGGAHEGVRRRATSERPPIIDARPRPRRPRKARPEEPDRCYAEALELQRAGQKREALTCLERLFAEHPTHTFGRLTLFQLASDLRDQTRASEHHDWIVSHYLQGANAEGLCGVYRETRITFPELRWAEKSLIQVMHAGEKTHDARVAVDAAKLLIHTYPQSSSLPRALLVGARVQEQEGRPDLARATLQNIVSSYPQHPVAEAARRRLAQLA
jgi:outer membrane protein assembly factor BamD (BamD/ComL family)